MTTTMTDMLDSLRTNFRLLVTLNDLPDRETNPVWIMVYAKCAADIDWIIESGQDFWSDREQEYILDVHQVLTDWGTDALEKQ